MTEQRWRPDRRAYLIMAAIALVVGAVVAIGMPEPTYTDAYYYFNAGHRLATGNGLTDPYVALTYINAPDALPAPSHSYWMPLTSLLVALAGGSFRAAQGLFVLGWVALVLLAFWLGARLGGTRRHAWAAGLLTVFCAYYAPFLVTPDTFTPFGVFGAFGLLALGLGRVHADWRWFTLAGVLAALAHLTRADGLLLVGMVGLIALWPAQWLDVPGDAPFLSRRMIWLGGGLAGYSLTMLPWFIRNMQVLGTPLPVGGTATIWLRGYNELVSYPPMMSLTNFMDWGVGNILASRWEAFTNNLGTFVAVEGFIVLAPLIVIALVRRWRHPLLLPVWTYAVLLHLAMTFAFAYPGYRGGLFHSATALLPFWTVVGVLGLDDAVDWIARRRRGWRPAEAKAVFTVAVVILAAALTVVMVGARWGGTAGSDYTQLAADVLPPDAVVMSNDPAALYYHTGLPGIVVPDAGLDAVQELVTRYAVTHILLDQNRTRPLDDLYTGQVLPDYLQLIPQEVAPGVRVFAVVR
jgi:hypothetical protein